MGEMLYQVAPDCLALGQWRGRALEAHLAMCTAAPRRRGLTSLKIDAIDSG
jgi:hypothetical protein